MIMSLPSLRVDLGRALEAGDQIWIETRVRVEVHADGSTEINYLDPVSLPTGSYTFSSPYQRSGQMYVLVKGTVGTTSTTEP